MQVRHHWRVFWPENDRKHHNVLGQTQKGPDRIQSDRRIVCHGYGIDRVSYLRIEPQGTSALSSRWQLAVGLWRLGLEPRLVSASCHARACSGSQAHSDPWRLVWHERLVRRPSFVWRSVPVLRHGPRSRLDPPPALQGANSMNRLADAVVLLLGVAGHQFPESPRSSSAPPPTLPQCNALRRCRNPHLQNRRSLLAGVQRPSMSFVAQQQSPCLRLSVRSRPPFGHQSLQVACPSAVRRSLSSWSTSRTFSLQLLYQSSTGDQDETSQLKTVGALVEVPQHVRWRGHDSACR